MLTIFPYLQILAEDAKHNRDKLKQLKDFDQRAAKEIVAEAFIERKRRQVEVRYTHTFVL